MIPTTVRRAHTKQDSHLVLVVTHTFFLLAGLIWLFDVDVTNPGLLGCSGALIGLMLFLCLFGLWTHTDALRPGCLLLIGLLIASALLGLAGFAVQLWGLPGEPLLDWAFFLFGLVLLAGLPSWFFPMFEVYYYQEYLAEKLYRDLGFEHNTNSMPGGGKFLYIAHLQPDGLLAEAGFRAGDVVLDKHGSTDFFRMLERARGGPPLTITIARSAHAVAYADPRPIADRPKVELSVRVPPKNYSVRLEKELGFRCALDYVEQAGQWLGVLVITDIRCGGAMNEAGGQDRDILCNVGRAPGFFDRLAKAREDGQVTVEMVPWIDPVDVRDRPVRELTLQIPSRISDGEPVSGYQARLRMETELETDLGFTFGSEWLPMNGEWQGTRTIEQLVPDGILAQSGFREKDIVLPESLLYHRRFPHSWEKARGGEPILVRVASWVEPPPLHERPRRVLTVRFPVVER